MRLERLLNREDMMKKIKLCEKVDIGKLTELFAVEGYGGWKIQEVTTETRLLDKAYVDLDRLIEHVHWNLTPDYTEFDLVGTFVNEAGDEVGVYAMPLANEWARYEDEDDEDMDEDMNEDMDDMDDDEYEADDEECEAWGLQLRTEVTTQGDPDVYDSVKMAREWAQSKYGNRDNYKACRFYWERGDSVNTTEGEP